jgi:hypothetical protein
MTPSTRQGRRSDTSFQRGKRPATPARVGALRRRNGHERPLGPAAFRIAIAIVSNLTVLELTRAHWRVA